MLRTSWVSPTGWETARDCSNTRRTAPLTGLNGLQMALCDHVALSRGKGWVGRGTPGHGRVARRYGEVTPKVRMKRPVRGIAHRDGVHMTVNVHRPADVLASTTGRCSHRVNPVAHDGRDRS